MAVGIAIGVALALLCLTAAVLPPAAQASGWVQVSVVDRVSQTSVAGVTVEIDTWTVDPNDSMFVARWFSDVAPSGYALPAGKYEVMVEDRSGVYASQFWNDRVSRSHADALTVVDGQTTDCVVQLDQAGHIIGTVTDTSGTPLQDIYIHVQGVDVTKMDFGGEAWTDASGHYDIGGLPTGSFTVEAQDFSEKYLYQFYPDQPSYATATPFDVVAGQDLEAPTITMKQAAIIDGGITTHLGVVPHDVMCSLESKDPTGKWVETVAWCCNNDCTYHIGQIPAGRYRLCFYWEGHPNNRQYYPGTFDPSQAQLFDIAEGQHLTGIDAVIWGDTEAPVTQAPLANTVTRGAATNLAYRIVDKGLHGPRADVTIKIKTFAGKTVKVVRLAKRPVNQLRHLHFACNLSRGRYRFCVFAVDSGGNHQRRIASNVLTVK